jgi:hypothetical protein
MYKIAAISIEAAKVLFIVITLFGFILHVHLMVLEKLV